MGSPQPSMPIPKTESRTPDSDEPPCRVHNAMTLTFHFISPLPPLVSLRTRQTPPAAPSPRTLTSSPVSVHRLPSVLANILAQQKPRSVRACPSIQLRQGRQSRMDCRRPSPQRLSAPLHAAATPCWYAPSPPE